MNILVTGGSGTIGGYVLRELLRTGHSVSDYSRSAPLVTGVRFIRGDVTDLDELKRACHGHDAIVHLANTRASASVMAEQAMYANVMATVRILEAALAANVRKIVYASSGAATGFSYQIHEIIPRYLPVDEEHPCEPHDFYGLGKLLCELTCKRYSDAYGMATICLRINNNWYLDRKGAEIVVRSGWAKGMTVEEDLWRARYRRSIELPDGEWGRLPTPRNLLWAVTDARDAAQAFRLAVENDKLVHEVFLINGADTSSREPTPVLLARYFPQVPLKKPMEGYASLLSHDRATLLLGYQPQYTWREGEFARWLANQQSE